MLTRTTCKQEIEELHEFFEAWYAGEADALDRLTDVLGAEFEMVTPEGELLDREMLVDGIAESHARNADGTFAIDIRNVELLAGLGDHALVRYEEWQTQNGSENGRISTVLFRSDQSAPNDLVWVSLQETWLEPPDSRQS